MNSYLDFYLDFGGSIRFDPIRIGLASFWDALQTTLRETVGPPLKSIQEPVDVWLGQLPMSIAIACAVGLYVAALIWVWTLRREFIFRGAPDERRWRDLRVWATIVILPYITVYLLIGR